MIDKRLRALFDELVSNEGYVSGRRSFPRTLTPDDAVAMTAELHEELDQAAEARAHAAARMGKPLACGPGCSGCCEELVMVFQPEVLRVARWLAHPDNAAVRQRFLDAYPAWKARVGDAPAELEVAFIAGDNPAFLAKYRAQWRKRVLCAFNQDGMCTIYEVRPLVCRNAHAVGTSAHCVGDDPSGRIADRMESKQFDAWFEQVRGAVRAAHHAIGGAKQRPRSVVEAVYELVSGATMAPS
ncbi:MAG: YkgJ family cysteine cluster protein [Deltaproteobacteria bacterium]|nr:YkgJ family cysteine cluster protein [Deltaproteobacteria bacterium]